MLRFALEQGGPGLVVTETAMATMRRYRQTGPFKKEAGGQLFAQFIGSDAVIQEATPPTRLDRCTRFRFWPNRRLQQEQIYDRHKRGLHFVGDWHTHPESIPNPSPDDIYSMMECFNSSVHELRSFVLILVGLEKTACGLYVALVNGSNIKRLMHENQ